MIGSLVKNWWAIGVVGGLAMILGLMAFGAPLRTLASLVIAFGAYALVSGIFHVAAGVTGDISILGPSRAWIITTGVLSILAGLATFFWPGLTALVLLYVIAAWAIFTGILEIMTAISLRREVDNEWMMILGGALSVLFGLILAFLPGVGLLSLTWLIGIYALIFGVAFIVLGFRVRSHGASSRVT